MSQAPITLVVLAAGMGSRFGGLKQVAPVGPDGETILDYSLRDAAAAGFSRVVFIIRPEIEETFREIVLTRIPGNLETVLVHQDREDLPPGWTAPTDRTKPWGTGQAVYAARHAVRGPFMVINADDYYGPTAFQVLAEFMRSRETDAEYAMAGYPLGQTLSDYGAVSRGVCQLDASGTYLAEIAEHHGISRDGERLRGTSAGEERELTAETIVSLNAWAFREGFWEVLEDGLKRFLDGLQDPLREEYYLPTAVQEGMKRGHRVRVFPVPDHWLGVTYAEDLPRVRELLADWRRSS